MSIVKRGKAKPPAPVEIRPGDHVSWYNPYRLHAQVCTGTVNAIANDIARVVEDGKDTETQVACSALTITKPPRDDEKAAALIAVYAALSERAEAGDLTAWAFLEDDWPKLVTADLRALLDIGPDRDDQ